MTDLRSCIGCPSNEGAQLRELAVQFQGAGEWLLQNDGIGTFSTNAVRTAVLYYDVDRPADHPYYGTFTHPQRPPDMVSDLARQAAPLDPAKVEVLRAFHDTRVQRARSFDLLSLGEKRRYAQAAAPFICALLCKAAAKEPALLRPPSSIGQRSTAELLAETAAVRRQAEMCRPLNDPDVHTLRRLHWLDQGAYLAAQHAWINCPGPWVRVRTEVGFPRGQPELNILTICPQGRRDKLYHETEAEIKNQPNEP